MKVKLLLVSLMLVSTMALVANQQTASCAEITALAAQAETARANLPFFLRWGMPTAAVVIKAHGGAACRQTPEVLAAAIVYQKQQEEMATNPLEREVHAQIGARLEQQLAALFVKKNDNQS